MRKGGYIVKFKKIISIFLTVICCFSFFSICVSAKSKEATNPLKTNGNGGKTDVGTWYMTYNNVSMWANNFGSGNAIRYRALVSRNPNKYGVPDSTNIKEIDMHLEMLSEAKIDFVTFDLTNGGLTKKISYGTGNEWIVDNAKLTCQRIAKWNKSHDWKIKYTIAVGTYPTLRGGASIGYTAEAQAEAVYKDFFENKEYGGDNFYQMDGKPMLILYDWTINALEEWDYYSGDKTYGNKFTIRPAQQGEIGTYGWQTNYGTLVNDEVEVICPGWTQASGGGVIARDNGKYYQKNWDIILDNKLPRIVMIMAFNDFNEHLAFMPADSSECDNILEVKWTDETGELNNSMYWDMTVEGIRQIRITNGELPKDNWYLKNWTLTVPITVSFVSLVIAVAVAIAIIRKIKKNNRKRESL